MFDKPPAIIVDLDGTLCNIDHRRHFIENHPKDWESFFAGIEHDKPNKWCDAIVKAMMVRGYKIIFVSGRADSYFNTTISWIKDHVGLAYSYGYYLHMRTDGDFRQDSIIKEEIYRSKIEPFYDVLFCIDDRKQVVDMWRKNGLTVLQCDDGNF